METTSNQLKNLERALSGKIDPSASNLKKAVDNKKNFPYRNMISPSMYDKYMKCPKQWELRYKDKNYEPEDNPDTMFGDVMHGLVEKHLEAKYGNQSFDFEETLRSEILGEAREVKDYWKREAQESRSLPFDKQTLCDIERDAKKVLSEFKEFTDVIFPDNLELVCVEEKFGGKAFNNLDFEGRIDIVLYNPETEMFYIVDLKTSRRGWTDRKIKDKVKRTQLLSYKYYFSQSLDIPPDNIKTLFLIFNRDGSGRNERYDHLETVLIPSESEDIKAALLNLKTFVKETTSTIGYFKNKEYEKRPNKFICMNCPYSTEFNGTGQCDQGGERWEN